MSKVWPVFVSERYMSLDVVKAVINADNCGLIKIFDTKEKALNYIKTTPNIDLLKAYDGLITDNDTIEFPNEHSKSADIRNEQGTYFCPKQFEAIVNDFHSEFYVFTFEQEVE